MSGRLPETASTNKHVTSRIHTDITVNKTLLKVFEMPFFVHSDSTLALPQIPNLLHSVFTMLCLTNLRR